MTSPLVCSFCARPASDNVQLVAGPRILICDSCLVHALARILRSQIRNSEFDVNAERYCSFCGKKSKDVSSLAVHDGLGICDECITLSIGIILDKFPRGRVVDLPPWNLGNGEAG